MQILRNKQSAPIDPQPGLGDLQASGSGMAGMDGGAGDQSCGVAAAQFAASPSISEVDGASK
jgi:hypothetical protein